MRSRNIECRFKKAANFYTSKQSVFCARLYAKHQTAVKYPEEYSNEQQFIIHSSRISIWKTSVKQEQINFGKLNNNAVSNFVDPRIYKLENRGRK